MRCITVAGIVALAGLGFSDAHAALQTPIVSGGTVQVTNPQSGKYTVTVTSGTAVTVTLRFDAGDIVDEVAIVPLNQSGTRVSVTVEGVAYAPNPDNPDIQFYGLHHIRRVVRGDGTGEVWITKVQANIIGDVERDLEVGGLPNPDYGKTSGLVRANLIGDVIANWSVFADVEAIGTSLSNPDLENDVINSVRADREADWHPEYATDGAILGDIRSNGGRIGTIRAYSFIGAVNNVASSNTQVIDTNGGNIGLIEAGALGDVVIDCIGSGSGTVTEIRTTVAGWGYDEGREVYLGDPIDFEDPNRPTGLSVGGVLLAGGLGTLELKGSLDSVIDIFSTPQSGTWKIGDSLGPNALVTLRSLGLNGQIAINANGDNGQWLGVVRVARTSDQINGPWFVMDEAAHDAPPSGLGAGVAGLQGDALWGNSCDPVPGSTRFRGSIDPGSFELDPPCIEEFNTIRVGFYGRIERINSQEGWSETILLEKRQGSLNQFSEVQPGFFTVSPDGERKIKLVRGSGLWETGEYRVTVKENKLRVRSDDVLAGQPQLAVPTTQYTFSIARGCPEFDLTGDFLINFSDLAEWMTSPVNINDHPEVDSNDAATLLRGILEHGTEN